MNKQPTIIKTLPIAILASFFLTRYVHGRWGDETFMCDGAKCELGSGLSWLLTGVSLLGPFIALAGFFWSRRQHLQGRLGPFSSRAIPDGEQILEVLAVVGGALIAYWLMLNGPSIEHVEIGKPNTWVEALREFRAPEEALRTANDRAKLDEVPSRRTWFAIGLVLGGPFAFSFGTMLGREWYGRKRRKAQRAEDEATTVDVTRSSPDIDLATIDLNAIDNNAINNSAINNNRSLRDY